MVTYKNSISCWLPDVHVVICLSSKYIHELSSVYEQLNTLDDVQFQTPSFEVEKSLSGASMTQTLIETHMLKNRPCSHRLHSEQNKTHVHMCSCRSLDSHGQIKTYRKLSDRDPSRDAPRSPLSVSTRCSGAQQTTYDHAVCVCLSVFCYHSTKH